MANILTRVLITKAIGPIAQHMANLASNGNMLPNDRDIFLQLYDDEASSADLARLRIALLGIAHPNFRGVLATPIIEAACHNVEFVVGIGEFAGSTPQSRRATMTRNFGIYRRLAEALAGHALANCKILIFSHPASIGARVIHQFAPLLPLANITSLTRSDQDMAVGLIANRLGVGREDVQNLICWGINSTIQHVDITHGWIQPNNQAVRARIGNDNWVMVELTGAIQNRGMDIRTRPPRTAYINNVASSICNHIWDWCSGTPANQWVSVGMFSNGAYNVPQNTFASFPATCQPGGGWNIVGGLPIVDFMYMNAVQAREQSVQFHEEAEPIFQLGLAEGW